MLQILQMIDYLLWKYGKHSIEDGDRVFDFMNRFMMVTGIALMEVVKFLYDSGIVDRLVTAAPIERKKALAQAFEIVFEEFPEDDEFIKNILAIFARGFGYPMEVLEPYCESTMTGLQGRLSEIGSKSEQELEAIEDFFLGNFYHLRGNRNVAIDHWKKAAEAGNISAATSLMALFHPDKEMERWYLDVLGSQDSIGLFEAGKILSDLEDYKKSEMLLKKSAELGCVGAMLLLSGLYEDVLDDPASGEEWLAKAAETGEVTALLSLAQRANKRGDMQEAFEWLIKIAEQGNFEYMAEIAKFYEYQLRDYNKAEEWYVKAAESGDSELVLLLADFYKDVRKKFDKAKKLYLKLALAGNGDAMAELGDLYENNLHDDKKAEKCYRKSIAAGSLLGEDYYDSFLERREMENSGANK